MKASLDDLRGGGVAGLMISVVTCTECARQFVCDVVFTSSVTGYLRIPMEERLNNIKFFGLLRPSLNLFRRTIYTTYT